MLSRHRRTTTDVSKVGCKVRFAWELSMSSLKALWFSAGLKFMCIANARSRFVFKQKQPLSSVFELVVWHALNKLARRCRHKLMRNYPISWPRQPAWKLHAYCTEKGKRSRNPSKGFLHTPRVLVFLLPHFFPFELLN